MGTQQLLLLAFASLVVGLALSTGMDKFASGAEGAYKDQLRNEAVRVAKHAQAWYRSPEAIGGGGRSFSSFSFESINYDSSKVVGVLAISNLQANTFRLTARLHDDAAWSLVMDVYPDTVTATEGN